MRWCLPMLLLCVACAGSTVGRDGPLPSAPGAGVRPVYKVDNGILLLPGPITFAAGEAMPAAASEPALQHVIGFLRDSPSITKLRIEVHGDGVGDQAAEQTLSEARALAVQLRLLELGADEGRLLAVGFGDSKPVAATTTPEGQAQNRRVEFHPAELRGRAIGGMPLDGGGRLVTPK